MKSYMLLITFCLTGCGLSSPIDGVRINKALYFCGASNVKMIQTIWSPQIECIDGTTSSYIDVILPAKKDR